MAGGFFEPNKEDLFRIRKEFEIDASEIRKILNEKEFKKTFGNLLQTNAVKSAPKGFDKDHENIDLIKLKSFVVKRSYTNEEVLSEDFAETLVQHYKQLRLFFDYMSSVLTTDLNGVSLLDDL
ncbi:TIGR02453 family protein [Aequorivita viscosa]|uniref:TIGR02453 family protein n=1 Tax=Aequorivita viscosa TaxID=797419 RepID=A0A1M6EHC4_9FLAO|nr:TIGR02453 family protein [Aequorivita viscosa]SHI84874.1 TIGR02453 family protein [Aequorivita viscosa]